MSDDDRDYEVGYGRPPKHSQFRKGQSGNPKGRPRKDPSMCETFRRIANQKVRVNGKDGPHYITKWEAAMTQLLNKAATGDLKATQMVMNAAEKFPDLVTEPLQLPNVIFNFVEPKWREGLADDEVRPGETYEEWQKRLQKETEQKKQ